MCIVKLSNEQLASSDINGLIKIWNINNGECLKTIEAHTESINVLFLAKLSKNSIVSFSEDRKIKIWHTDSSSCLNILQDHTSLYYYIDLF